MGLTALGEGITVTLVGGIIGFTPFDLAKLRLCMQHTPTEVCMACVRPERKWG